MGMDAEAQINFGVVLAEEWPMPWVDPENSVDDPEGCLTEWWIHQIHGFKHVVKPWTDAGERTPGVSEEDISRYFDEQKEWLKEEPLPVQLICTASSDDPVWILSVPGSFFNSWEKPVEVVIPMTVPIGDRVTAFVQFLQEYGVAYTKGPCWLLSSYLSY